MGKLKASICFLLLTVSAFVLTRNPVTGPYKVQMAFLMLLVFATYTGIMRKRLSSIFQRQMFMFMVSGLVLFLVGATSWFFSPFFYVLYLLIILLNFTFPFIVSLVLSSTLIFLLSFNICEVDCTYDSITILSLFSTIPLSYYLKNIFLQQQEEEKEILILRKEKKEYQNKLEELLGNSINYFAVSLKQPINNMKQLAYLIKAKDTDTKSTLYSDRIIASSEEALQMLKRFEDDATERKLEKKSPPPSQKKG